jgi:exoribonuclease R
MKNNMMIYFVKGHFIKTLGKLGDKETENEVILAENDILHHEFPEAVLDCLPKLPWIITEEVRSFVFLYVPYLFIFQGSR